MRRTSLNGDHDDIGVAHVSTTQSTILYTTSASIVDTLYATFEVSVTLNVDVDVDVESTVSVRGIDVGTGIGAYSGRGNGDGRGEPRGTGESQRPCAPLGSTIAMRSARRISSSPRDEGSVVSTSRRDCEVVAGEPDPVTGPALLTSGFPLIERPHTGS
jgi:hypothetical protein